MRVSLRENSLDLSVVIPALNEASNLAVLVPKLHEALSALGLDYEILVIDGLSPDGTADLVPSLDAVYLPEPRPGYGIALLRGISEARGAYVMTLDADLSHPAAVAKDLWAARENADISIASRYVEGGHADQPWLRLMLSKVLNAFFGIGLDIPVRDLSSGYRLYRKNAFRRLDITFTNFVVLVEILLRAHALGFRSREIPFHYRPRGAGASKARIIVFGKDYLRLFFRLWRIRNTVAFPDYDWRAYHSRIPIQRYWQRARHALIRRFVTPDVSTCAIGFGSSPILAQMPQAVGVDTHHDKLVFMRRTNRLLARAESTRFPFEDGAFGCVVSSPAMGHIGDDYGTHLDECARILRPGGIMVFDTPDYGRWEWRTIEWAYRRIKPDVFRGKTTKGYTFASLATALNDRGLELLDHGYVGRSELIVKARKRCDTQEGSSDRRE